jgi:cobalt-zinc-cadmium efflux system membrane fusion protein
MTRKQKWMLPTLAALIALAVIVFAIKPAAEPDTAKPAAAPDASGEVKFLMEQQWKIRLKLAKAEPAAVARQITSTGRVVPAASNQAVISPPVGGIIGGETFPRIGQNVQRGQVLATLTQTPTASESAQIRVENARLEAEKRRLAQSSNEAQIHLNLAKTEFDRAARLYEKKAYSLKQLQAAEADYKAAEASLASAREQLNALETHPPAITTYQLRAPISGTVVTVHKSLGEQVNPGEPAFEIVNLDTVWVEAPIFERDLPRLEARDQAVFTTAAFPDTEFRGRLINIGAVIDEQTRAATAVFEVSNTSRRLRIGMQANLRLDAEERIEALLIPKESVLDNEGEKIVYVLLSGETFQRRTVRLGDEYGDNVAVLSGIMPGERVVTQGAYQLKLQELRPADAGAHSHEV